MFDIYEGWSWERGKLRPQRCLGRGFWLSSSERRNPRNSSSVSQIQTDVFNRASLLLRCLTFMKAEAGREWSCGHSTAWFGGLGFPQAKGKVLRRIQGKFLIELLGFPQGKGEIFRRNQGKFLVELLGFPQGKREIFRRIQGKFLVELLGFPQGKGKILWKIQGKFCTCAIQRQIAVLFGLANRIRTDDEKKLS